ncbi:hypothetical protein A2966_03850 [Candidatus Roizmanbacteria bacterium RIFCSPLOWO2_01_FULL_41_22]|uniref:Uncharacterized protein n=2 Tax=Candidatus Roizmaniibacteriota TaxID=1752723 RepID=A0A1F7JQP6_9BACT|nr:MAG: hypothetical protein A2966_03850 [Candidatus Roizmanbacteria bacterium RIFCSPLOWO2_01_FULL_41_22]OGK57939.1 MAG: hypothetical protein A3H86_01890 [Candidatus Roizmanbacteria bacterium RIFCSPLOWO2_02_FULL_41_9]
MKKIIFTALIIVVVAVVIILSWPTPTPQKSTNQLLSQVSYSLTNRYDDPSVNQVFVDNILLTLAYMSGKINRGDPIVWNAVKSAGVTELVLKPGQTFAFHDSVLAKYQGKIASTTNAHFISSEGFKSDGWLVGDGVCHLASFMYVVSKEAGLKTEAPTKHDFATIAEVPKSHGVSIFYSPVNQTSSNLQNLYITNTYSHPVAFIFYHKNDSLNIKVEKKYN